VTDILGAECRLEKSALRCHSPPVGSLMMCLFLSGAVGHRDEIEISAAQALVAGSSAFCTFR
jgi:hypothetical protein